MRFLRVLFWMVPCLAFSLPAAASTAGSACSAAGRVEQDAGRTLICDGTVWRMSSQIQSNGLVYFGLGSGDGGVHIGTQGRASMDAVADWMPQHALTVISGNDFVGFTMLDRDGDRGTVDDRDGVIFWGDNSDDNLRFMFMTSGSVLHNRMILTAAGRLGIGTTTPQSTLHVPNGQYAQFENFTSGPPPAADCNSTAQRGRLSIDATNNRLYICNGSAARGWDYVGLSD